MAYGTDVTVFVEDTAGDLGAPGSPAPWWLSPDVDIPAHSGVANQGPNQVRIRVHAHEEPLLDEKIAAEVYVGNPSLVLSPSSGTVRIDPGSLRFRPAHLTGSEPVANTAGGVLTFSWTPSSTTSAVDGPGHRCLVLRAFPVGVTPPSSPFDVPNEQHEAQRNIEVLFTTMKKSSGASGGLGTAEKPMRRDEDGLWTDEITTRAAGKRGRRFVVWALDPDPSAPVRAAVKSVLRRRRLGGFAKEAPNEVSIVPRGLRGERIDPSMLLKRRRFARRAGLGEGLFAGDRLLAAAAVELGPRKESVLLLRFDHSNLGARQALVLHGAQWREDGTPEGGLTVVAPAPVP